MRGWEIAAVGQVFDIDLRLQAGTQFKKCGGVQARIGWQRYRIADRREGSGLVIKPQAKAKTLGQIIAVPQAQLMARHLGDSAPFWRSAGGRGDLRLGIAIAKGRLPCVRHMPDKADLRPL